MEVWRTLPLSNESLRVEGWSGITESTRPNCRWCCVVVCKREKRRERRGRGEGEERRGREERERGEGERRGREEKRGDRREEIGERRDIWLTRVEVGEDEGKR